ncbi:MAG: hypothetical protein ACRD3V_17185, partial [Vicinamibacteria bacterium]
MVFDAGSGTIPLGWCLAPIATAWFARLAWFGRRNLRWRGGVARWIVLLSLLVASLIIVNAVIVHRFVAASHRNDPFLGLTNRQRLLCQRMEFLLKRVLEGEAASHTALKETMDVYDQALVVLETGGRFEDRVLSKPPPEMAASIATLKRTWGQVRP